MASRAARRSSSLACAIHVALQFRIREADPAIALADRLVRSGLSVLAEEETGAWREIGMAPAVEDDARSIALSPTLGTSFDTVRIDQRPIAA